MKIIDYKIIQYNDFKLLQETVLNYIKHGWIPQGGICKEPYYYCQAMIKYDNSLTN